MKKIPYVKLDVQIKTWLQSALPKRTDGKPHIFNGKYLRINDNKISYECIDLFDRARHRRMSFQELAAWYYDDPRLPINIIHKPINIEKTVPIPVNKQHYSILPFHKMEVGDSFFIERSRFKKSSLHSLKSFLYSMAKKYVVDNFVMDRFSLHLDRENVGVRVFRVE